MSQLAKSLVSALPFFPEHRKLRGRRAVNISLDDLLDEARMLAKVTDADLDIIFMGYRYGVPFEKFWEKFFGNKKLKPPPQLDLFRAGFALVLTRDNTPLPALVNECVEAHKSAFGKEVATLANAFYRQLARERDELRQVLQKNPEQFLSTESLNRWSKHPELVFRSGRQIAQRPPPGISALDLEKGEFEKLEPSDFFKRSAAFAVDLGSWLFCQWVDENFLKPKQKIWDMCAAPGGKTIGLLSLLKTKNHLSDNFILATELKSSRLERLEQNLKKASAFLNTSVSRTQVDCELLDVRLQALKDSEIGRKYLNQKWDLILLDLPCSGSGTWASRPDLISAPWAQIHSNNLVELQKEICATASHIKRLQPECTIIISVCSVDPIERSRIRLYLSEFKTKGEFFSWEKSDILCEGITAFAV